MKANISKKIRCLYWFLTIGIVMFHSFRLRPFKLATTSVYDKFIADSYNIIADRIGHIALTFFFFFSAFWLYSNTKNLKDIAQKLKKRVFSLIIPYLIWTLLFVTIKIVIGKLDMIEFFSKIHLYLFFRPIIGAMWYILSLIVLLLIYPPLALTNKNKSVSFCVFFFIAAYLITKKYFDIQYIFVPENWGWYYNMRFYMPIYILGGYIGLHHNEIVLEKEYNEKIHTVLGSILIILSILLFYILRMRKYYVLFSLINLSGLWLMLKDYFFKENLPKHFDSSFFVYVLHQPLLLPVIKLTIKNIIPIATMNGVQMVIIELVTIFFAVFFSCILRIILEKILPKKVLNLLTGGR